MATTCEREGGKRADVQRPVWKDHNLHVIWGVTLMAVLGSSSVSPAFPKVAAKLGISPGQVGLLITVFTLPGVFLTPAPWRARHRRGRPSTSVTTALTSTQIGRLTSRFSEEALVRASFVLYAVALALVAFVPYWWLLFVPTVIFGVAQSLNLPNVFSLLNEAAPDENRGAFLAAGALAAAMFVLALALIR